MKTILSCHIKIRRSKMSVLEKATGSDESGCRGLVILFRDIIIKETILRSFVLGIKFIAGRQFCA